MANFDPPPDKGKQDWERTTGKYTDGHFKPDWVTWDSEYHRNPERRTAIALEYIAWALGQINQKIKQEPEPELKQPSAPEYSSSPIPRK